MRCLLDGEVTVEDRSVTGYSNLRSTNVFRRSQSCCSAVSSFNFNNNSFTQNMRQLEDIVVGRRTQAGSFLSAQVVLNSAGENLAWILYLY